MVLVELGWGRILVSKEFFGYCGLFYFFKDVVLGRGWKRSGNSCALF